MMAFAKVRNGPKKTNLDQPTSVEIDRSMNMRRNIEFGLLMILTALAVLRPLIAETYDASPAPFSQSLGLLGEPMPARTATFDLIILGCACVWLLLRAVRPSRLYRWTGLEVGLSLLILASAVSCLWADQQRLAINASLDWLCYPILAIVLTQLMTKPWHRRLVTAAIIATASVQAFNCMEQYFVGQGETLAYYQSVKDSFWQAQGVELESPTVELFEQRMKANEAQGFLPHSNVTGSYLILTAFAAIGLWLERRRTAGDRASWRLLLLQSPIVLAILFAAYLTRSLGAVASAVVGLLFWAVSYVLRHRIAKQPRKFLVIGWAGVLAGITAFVGHGLYHDSFPHMSLTFRWQYWKATWPMVLDHWLTGVGRENFGRHYLQYKSIASPEEIANPHNLFVQAAAEWGLIGLAGVVAMIVGVTIVLTNRRKTPLSRLHTNDTNLPVGPLIVAGFTWAVVVTVIRIPLLGSDNPSFLYYTTTIAALCFVTGFTLFGWPMGRLAFVDKHKVEVVSSNPFAMALSAGLVAFLVHEMINFAMFVPATATTFSVLLAVRLAESNPPIDANKPIAHSTRWFLPILATTATAVTAFLIVSPVWRSNSFLEQARHVSISPTRQDLVQRRAEKLLIQAAKADPLDPAPHAEYAQWLLATQKLYQQNSFSPANQALEQAILRDPYYVRYRRLQRKLALAWFDFDKDSDHLELAIESARKSLLLYPQDPDSLIDLGDTLALAAQQTGRNELRREAIKRYEEALDLDSRRAWFERIRRYSEAHRQSIVDRINALKSPPLPRGDS